VTNLEGGCCGCLIRIKRQQPFAFKQDQYCLLAQQMLLTLIGGRVWSQKPMSSFGAQAAQTSSFPAGGLLLIALGGAKRGNNPFGV
jgi:hypothetical protein